MKNSNELMAQLIEGQEGLKTDVSELKDGQRKLEADVATLKTDVTALKSDVTELKDGQRKLTTVVLNIENILLTKLNVLFDKESKLPDRNC